MYLRRKLQNAAVRRLTGLYKKLVCGQPLKSLA